MSTFFSNEVTASAMSEQSPVESTAANSGSRHLWIAIAVLIAGLTAVSGAMMWPAPVQPKTPVTPLVVKRTLPHDRSSFCQGLVIEGGVLFEGTGHYGESRLRRLDIDSGVASIDVAMPDSVFGEGITIFNGVLYQLTWKENVMLAYDPATLKRTGGIPYRQIDRSLKEGWGLTHDGKQLIISDGSSYLRFVDPRTMKMVRRVKVKDGFRSISKLNELEYVNGEILANIWYSNQIARIDPATGRVRGWLDATRLRPAEVARDKEAALNGIAWDAKNKKLYITGKNWPVMYEVTW